MQIDGPAVGEITVARMPEVVYLLHYDAPISELGRRPQHYIGTAKNVSQLTKRMEEHRSGNKRQSSALTAYAAQQGIPFRLARVWEAHGITGRGLERRKKNRHGGPVRLCPICNG